MRKRKMQKKKTKAEKFEELKVIIMATGEDYSEQIEFIESEIKALSKKNDKPTKAQEANAILCEKILDLLTASAGKLHSIKDIQSGVAELAEASNQKVSALLKILVDGKSVIRTESKRSVFYSVPVPVEEDFEELEEIEEEEEDFDEEHQYLDGEVAE